MTKNMKMVKDCFKILKSIGAYEKFVNAYCMVHKIDERAFLRHLKQRVESSQYAIESPADFLLQQHTSFTWDLTGDAEYFKRLYNDVKEAIAKQPT